MKHGTANADQNASRTPAPAPTSTSIDWYHEGQSRTVEVDGVRIVVRFVGRRGRRARIAIEAPAGAVFGSFELRTSGESLDRT